MNAPGSPPNRPDSSSGSSTVSVPSSAALSGDEQVGHLVQIAVPTSIYIVQVAVPANLYSLGCCLNKFIQSRLLSQLVFIQFRLLFQLVFIQARLLSQPVVILVPNSFFFIVQQVYLVQVAVPIVLIVLVADPTILHIFQVALLTSLQIVQVPVPAKSSLSLGSCPNQSLYSCCCPNQCIQSRLLSNQSLYSLSCCPTQSLYSLSCCPNQCIQSRLLFPTSLYIQSIFQTAPQYR